jgi:amino acid transporter
VSTAVYPTLFLEYVTSVAGNKEIGFGARFSLIAAITVVLSLLNYRGLEIVGNASLVVCIIAMSPFVLMTIIGAPQVVPSRWFQMPEQPDDGSELFDDAFQTSPGPLPLLSMAGIMWRPYLNNLFWNLNSFDGAASFAGETTCVRTTYPRGIFVGLVLCIVCYIVPMLVALGATDYKQSEWVDGHLGAVAVDIGGTHCLVLFVSIGRFLHGLNLLLQITDRKLAWRLDHFCSWYIKFSTIRGRTVS